MPTYKPERAGSGLRSTRLRISEETAKKHGYESYNAMKEELGNEAANNIVDEHMGEHRAQVRGQTPQGTMTSGLPGCICSNRNDDE